MHPGSGSSQRQTGSSITRRGVLGAAAVLAATPALAEECHIGPPAHAEGPRVWLDLDQVELDAAYDQSVYAPLGRQILARQESNSELTRQRLGPPRREAYGPTEIEKLDIFRTKRPKAPIFTLHSWRCMAARPCQRLRLSGGNLCQCRRALRRPGLYLGRCGERRLARDGGPGSARHRLDLQERREF